VFKKSQLKPWQKKQWCIGKIDGDYLAAMEDVLELYGQAPEQDQVRVCIDERPCQLLQDVWVPLPIRAGQAQRYDYTYKRKGTCSIFMAYDIDKGIRYAAVLASKTKADYATFLSQLLAQHYPQAKRIELVQDNLNTHKYGSFYQHLSLHRASQLRKRITFHYTPKHGSWLNMVEIEFSALARQCLNKRIGTMEQMKQQIQPWVMERNKKQIKIHWSFTVPQAREKLKSQYQKVSRSICL
jgi:transposase